MQWRDKKYFCLLEAFVLISICIWTFRTFRKPAVHDKTLSLRHGSFRSQRKSARTQFSRVSYTRRHTLRAGTGIQSASRCRNTASSWLSGSSGLTNVSSSTTLEVSVTHILPGQGCRINNIYLLQLGCYPVAVVILHVYKTWNWLLLNLSREGYMRSM